MRNPAQCPVRGCPAQLREPHVLCSRHWYTVPLPIRKEVWRAWREQPGSVRHRRAVQQAIGAAEARLASL